MRLFLEVVKLALSTLRENKVRSFLTVLGLIVLRIRAPKLERPYKVWGYPVTPIMFLAITLHMMLYVIREKTTESLLGLITVIAGLIIYFFAREPGPKIHSAPFKQINDK